MLTKLETDYYTMENIIWEMARYYILSETLSTAYDRIIERIWNQHHNELRRHVYGGTSESLLN